MKKMVENMQKHTIRMDKVKLTMENLILRKKGGLNKFVVISW